LKRTLLEMKTRVVITSKNEMRILEKGWIIIGINYESGNSNTFIELGKVKIDSNFEKSFTIEKNHNGS